jgi:hypothetical protein
MLVDGTSEAEQTPIGIMVDRDQITGRGLPLHSCASWSHLAHVHAHTLLFVGYSEYDASQCPGYVVEWLVFPTAF